MKYIVFFLVTVMATTSFANYAQQMYEGYVKDHTALGCTEVNRSVVEGTIRTAYQNCKKAPHIQLSVSEFNRATTVGQKFDQFRSAAKYSNGEMSNNLYRHFPKGAIGTKKDGKVSAEFVGRGPNQPSKVEIKSNISNITKRNGGSKSDVLSCKGEPFDPENPKVVKYESCTLNGKSIVVPSDRAIGAVISGSIGLQALLKMQNTEGSFATWKPVVVDPSAKPEEMTNLPQGMIQ